MAVGVHLTVFCQLFQRLALKYHRVIIFRYIVEHFRLAHEIAGIDPVAVTVRFLLKGQDLVTSQIDLQGSELATRLVAVSETAQPEASCALMLSAILISETPSP